MTKAVIGGLIAEIIGTYNRTQEVKAGILGGYSRTSCVGAYRGYISRLQLDL